MVNTTYVVEDNSCSTAASANGRFACFQVRGAFEKLYSYLAGELENAAQQGDTPLQFALMDAWGVEVHEDDHDLLARVRIFNILQVGVGAVACLRGTAVVGGGCGSEGWRAGEGPVAHRTCGRPTSL